MTSTRFGRSANRGGRKAEGSVCSIKASLVLLTRWSVGLGCRC